MKDDYNMTFWDYVGAVIFLIIIGLAIICFSNVMLYSMGCKYNFISMAKGAIQIERSIK
jgi:hypothetical protein